MASDNPPQEPGHEEWIRRLHVVLQQHFRRAGRGSVQRVEAALGIGAGSFRQWRKRGRLGLEMLFRALEELEVHPARFWVEVFGCELDPVQFAKHPTGPPKDPVVRRAVERWQKSEHRGSAEMTEDQLKQLDALRSENPKLAVRRAKSALGSAGQTWLPRLLAVYGSARRAQARLEQALEALHYALLLAEGHDQRFNTRQK